MSGQYTKIIATDYNTIQKKISAVLGSGGTDPNTNLSDNTFGYNQSVLSSQVAVNAKISSNQWTNLRTDILKTRQHQTGATEVLTDPTVSVIITEADRYSYNAMADQCIVNRLINPPPSQATRDTVSGGTYTVPWNGTLTHTTTITFSDSSAMLYYFNTGGFLDITAGRSGGSASVKNSSWSTMLTNIGTIRFGRSSTLRIDTGNNVTTASSIGYTGLTTSDQLLYQKSTENSTYTPNVYNLYVRTNATSNQIIYTIQFADLSGQPNSPWGSDEFIDGTLSSTIQTYRATGSNVSISLPSSSNSFSGGDGYSVIPSTYAINEGQSVTFNITTSGIIDGTVLYWTTTGSASTSDFSDSQTSGSVTITSNIGSVTRTLNNDLSIDEGQESFSFQLRSGSTSGTVLTTSAPVTVNDTSVATFLIAFYDAGMSVNEGGTATFIVTTSGISNGTVLYWTTTGTVSSSRFTDGLTSGSVTINSNMAFITRSITNDYFTDGPTYFSLQLRTGSTSGTIRSTSAAITVNDTSIEVASVTQNRTYIGNNFGGNITTVTFTVSTNTFSNGTTLYWQVVDVGGTYQSNTFNDGAKSGSFVINSNSGSISRVWGGGTAVYYFQIWVYKDAAHTQPLYPGKSQTIQVNH